MVSANSYVDGLYRRARRVLDTHSCFASVSLNLLTNAESGQMNTASPIDTPGGLDNHYLSVDIRYLSKIRSL